MDEKSKSQNEVAKTDEDPIDVQRRATREAVRRYLHVEQAPTPATPTRRARSRVRRFDGELSDISIHPQIRRKA
jgi:hypothetical protein